jgi:hypothetical protein
MPGMGRSGIPSVITAFCGPRRGAFKKVAQQRPIRNNDARNKGTNPCLKDECLIISLLSDDTISPIPRGYENRLNHEAPAGSVGEQLSRTSEPEDYAQR